MILLKKRKRVIPYEEEEEADEVIHINKIARWADDQEQQEIDAENNQKSDDEFEASDDRVLQEELDAHDQGGYVDDATGIRYNQWGERDEREEARIAEFKARVRDKVRKLVPLCAQQQHKKNEDSEEDEDYNPDQPVPSETGQASGSDEDHEMEQEEEDAKEGGVDAEETEAQPQHEEQEEAEVRIDETEDEKRYRELMDAQYYEAEAALDPASEEAKEPIEASVEEEESEVPIEASVEEESEVPEKKEPEPEEEKVPEAMESKAEEPLAVNVDEPAPENAEETGGESEDRAIEAQLMRVEEQVMSEMVAEDIGERRAGGGGGRGRGRGRGGGSRVVRPPRPDPHRLPGSRLETINWNDHLSDEEQTSTNPHFCLFCEYTNGAIDIEQSKDLQDMIDVYVQNYNSMDLVLLADKIQGMYDKGLRWLLKEDHFRGLPLCKAAIHNHFHDHTMIPHIEHTQAYNKVKQVANILMQTMLVPDSLGGITQVIDLKKASLFTKVIVMQLELGKKLEGVRPHDVTS